MNLSLFVALIKLLMFIFQNYLVKAVVALLQEAVPYGSGKQASILSPNFHCC
jgi:hypothetical protein